MSSTFQSREECGRIVKNINNQYFYICSTCRWEFVTIDSFKSHQTKAHDAQKLEHHSTKTTSHKDNQITDRNAFSTAVSRHSSAVLPKLKTVTIGRFKMKFDKLRLV